MPSKGQKAELREATEELEDKKTSKAEKEESNEELEDKKASKPKKRNLTRS